MKRNSSSPIPGSGEEESNRTFTDSLWAARTSGSSGSVWTTVIERVSPGSRWKSVATGPKTFGWLDEATEMGPSNSQSQLKTVMEYVQIGRDEGATLATGGRVLDSGTFAKGYFHEPTIFTDVSPSMRMVG